MTRRSILARHSQVIFPYTGRLLMNLAILCALLMPETYLAILRYEEASDGLDHCYRDSILCIMELCIYMFWKYNVWKSYTLLSSYPGLWVTTVFTIQLYIRDRFRRLQFAWYRTVPRSTVAKSARYGYINTEKEAFACCVVQRTAQGKEKVKNEMKGGEGQEF